MTNPKGWDETATGSTDVESAGLSGSLPRYYIDNMIVAQWMLHETEGIPLLRIGPADNARGYRLTTNEARGLARFIGETVDEAEAEEHF